MSLRHKCLVLLLISGLGHTAFAAGDLYNHVSHGPILGRLSAHGVGIWARTLRTGAFAVRYGTDPRRLDQQTKPVITHLGHDNTGWVHITGLAADTKYYYELFIPGQTGLTGKQGSFRTLPDSAKLVDPDLNPRGLFNFSFEFACGNNQNPGHSNGPGLPTFATMLKQLQDRIHFAILNGDWLYESRREYQPDQWLKQVDRRAADTPQVVNVAPAVVGVWQNYKQFLEQGHNMAIWHRHVPSFFTFDDHEILNDVWGAGSPGLRDRRAVFRDVGVRAWYDYLGWSNPTRFPQRIRFGRGRVRDDRSVLEDRSADFSKLDLAQANNLHIHWGTKTDGINDNKLDGVGGTPNAGVYRIVKILDKHRLKIAPETSMDETVSYSIGRRSYFRLTVANCDFFVLDTRSQRQMHDTKNPAKKGLSMLGPIQRDWLLDGVKTSKADFVFVVSSVNFMVPHIGGGKVRATNKDDAWTVFFDERERLINAWDKLDKPVFVLTGDLHNSFVIRITDNVWEFASGPHNSNNHWASDEGDRPANGRFQYGPRPVDIRWSSYFKTDIPRFNLRTPYFCVVQLNNVFNNPKIPGGTRRVAFPRPQVIFQYYNGKSGQLEYAESVLARPKLPPKKAVR
ncbi:MAG: alkaline phosphatase [Planctomycetaceae bacterium]|jgi:phosphodiesterase/alkaline phosphatase D-like protein|nr:alkaline phosphatase [Planctomycetaceae bacterium]MDP7274961.1 metallophosphoesterase family protein [Planctomycetaceae bacterium]